MVKGLLMAAAGLLALTSCSTAGKTGVSEAGYLDGEWNVTELCGKDMIYENALPYMVLNVGDSTLSGNAGCNTVRGKISLGAGNELSFGPVAATRMMCPEIETESAFLSALEQVKSFDVALTGEIADSVMLMDAGGEVVMKLMKRCSLDGRWNITKLGDKAVETEETVPFLDFRMNDGRVFGNLGCNSYNASVSLDEPAAKITFGMGAMTQMMCPNADIERELAVALSKVVSYRLDAGKGYVELTGNDGAVLLVLER